MNRKLAILHEFEARDFSALEQYYVFASLQLKVVGNAHGRNHVSQISGDLTPDARDAA